MKLTLKSSILDLFKKTPVLDFFKRDSRFKVVDTGAYWVIRFRDFEGFEGMVLIYKNEKLSFNENIQPYTLCWSLLSSQLLYEVDEQIKEINDGNLTKLKDLTDTLAAIQNSQINERRERQKRRLK